uniref:alpha/beta hydrolase n=1 Tax=Ningiella ruwaisensis TaxID=2364274 RepID=UPI0010A012D3|nr:alpha/beta hydrolase [Ningiella ruwaisensis]
MTFVYRPVVGVTTERLEIDHQGDKLALWQKYSDQTPKQNAATIIMAHGFGGTINHALLRYGDRFAEAGLRVILFDYRCFGQSSGWPRQWMSIQRRHEDYERVIQWCKEQHTCDEHAIVLWGSSLSGGHVMDIASKNTSIAGVIAQAPFADGKANTGSLKSALPLLYSAIRDKWREKRNKYPYYIASIGYPGEVAAMSSADAIPDDLWQQNIEANWENRITPRVFLEIINWRPGLKTKDIQCPLLVQVATKDVVTPPEPAQAAAARAPLGKCINYDIEHFEIYHKEPFEQAISHQLGFINEFIKLPLAHQRAHYREQKSAHVDKGQISGSSKDGSQAHE